MPIPIDVFRRNALVVCATAQVWGATCSRSLLHRAAEALLHGWGTRMREYAMLDRGLLIVVGNDDQLYDVGLRPQLLMP